MELDLEETGEPRRWFARALGVLILGVGLTIGAVGGWTYHRQRELLARRTLDTLATKACFEGRVLTEWSRRCAEGVEALRQTPGLGAYLAGAGPFPSQAFRGSMEAGGFDSACVTDALGRPLSGTACGALALAREMESPPGSTLAGGAPAFRFFAPDGETPSAVCWAAVPFAAGNRGGRFLVRGACAREPFQSSSLKIWSYYSSETVELCQWDRQGVLLLRLAPQPFAHSVVPADPDRAAVLAVSGEILQGSEPGTGGQRQLFATFFQPATRWGILVRMDAAEALETLRPTFLLLSGLELAVILLVGSGLLLLARRRHLRLLRRSHATLEGLLGRLLASQERERAAVSADLHDGICQILQAAETQAARAEMGAGNPDAREAAGEARKQIGDAARATRTLMAGLVPQALRRFGLAAALESLASDSPCTPKVQMRISCGSEADALPAWIREHLFRIAQEAIQNARKHSGAASVTVILEKRGGAIHLEIRDDGRGFPVARDEPLARQFGLGIMRQRARSIGASLKVLTGPEGTRIHVRLSIPPGSGEAAPGESAQNP